MFQYHLSNTPVPSKWNSSTSLLKLQYKLCGTKVGTEYNRKVIQDIYLINSL